MVFYSNLRPFAGIIIMLQQTKISQSRDGDLILQHMRERP